MKAFNGAAPPLQKIIQGHKEAQYDDSGISNAPPGNRLVLHGGDACWGHAKDELASSLLDISTRHDMYSILNCYRRWLAARQ